MLFSLQATSLLVPMFLGTRESEIGPGIGGFIATFVMVAATVFLIRDMGRRIRRVRHRAMLEQELQEHSFPVTEVDEEPEKKPTQP